ncbi:MAG: hypothetical protein M1821_001290 [Bathelium mastoideum]|nr:MAG: hypothetical protein M1821_001290 [Bathelium mastoideum]
MTTGGEAVSFDEIIQEGRRKRKFQNLADEILGKGKRSNAALVGSKLGRNVPTGPASTIANRGGIMKRSSSASLVKSNINGKWGHDLHHTTTARLGRFSPLPRSQSSSRLDRGNRAFATLQSELSKDEDDSQVNVVGNGKKNNISIKGIAGPYIVVASNFAAGTTAADIEAVMSDVGGEMLSCRLISASPTVMAEMQFTDKDGAERVISTFNNQRADGRLLHVYMKAGGPSPPVPNARGRRDERSDGTDRDAMDVDDSIPTGPAIDRPARDRYSYPSRRPDVQDGRYGFESDRDWYDRRDYRGRRDERGLVSDSMIGGRGYRR